MNYAFVLYDKSKPGLEGQMDYLIFQYDALVKDCVVTTVSRNGNICIIAVLNDEFDMVKFKMTWGDKLKMERYLPE